MSKRTHRSGARSARRLESILIEQLQSYIRDAADPALEGVRLVSLRLSKDGSHARVPYAVEAAPCDAARVERASREALERATGYLRSLLADLLDLKRLPSLTFTFVGVQASGAAPDSSGGGDPWLG